MEKIDYSELKFGECIAKGETSNIFKGTWKQHEVVIKQFRSSNPTQKQLQSFKQACSKLRHPALNIVYGYTTDEKSGFCIVSEFCGNGTLQQRIMDNNCSQKELLIMMKKIVSGLVYLHENKIVHRNLKPQNILIDNRGNPKLTDYGICEILKAGSMSTPNYTAPEIFKNQPYSFLSDVYSVGCILWQIDTRKEAPWSELSNTKMIINTIVNQKKTLRPSKNCPKALRQLIVKCVQHDPKKRPTMIQVLKLLKNIVQKIELDEVFKLANMYHFGEDVPRDYSKALELYTKAADKGHADALYNLGMMYYNGNGVQLNCPKAFEFYTKAANKGHANAQNNLGQMYEKGLGVPQNYSKAIEFYSRAAKQNHADAMCNLAMMYYYGKGVPTKFSKSYNLFSKAADLGHPNGIKNFELLKILKVARTPLNELK